MRKSADALISRTNSRPKVRTLQMPKIAVFISKAGVSKLDWPQFFFLLFVIVFLEEVEKDVKIKQVLR